MCSGEQWRGKACDLVSGIDIGVPDESVARGGLVASVGIAQNDRHGACGQNELS